MWVSDTIKSNFANRIDTTKKIIKNSGIACCQIGIFGSYARNEYTGHSDIDVCVICETLPERMRIAVLRSELEAINVDCIVMTKERFLNENSKFLNNVRRDFREIKL